MFTRKLNTASEVGCWADGSFGHDHVREVLQTILTAFNAPEKLADALTNDTSDDGSEEYDAVDWLNTNACEASVRFEIVEGDLCLLRADEDDA